MYQGFIDDQQKMQHCMSGLLLIFEIPLEEISQQSSNEEADGISMLSYSQASVPDRWSSTASATDAPPLSPTRCNPTIKSDHTPRIPRRPSQDENTISSFTSTTTSKVDKSPRLPRRHNADALGESTHSSVSCDKRPTMPRRTNDSVVTECCC